MLHIVHQVIVFVWLSVALQMSLNAKPILGIMENGKTLNIEQLFGAKLESNGPNEVAGLSVDSDLNLCIICRDDVHLRTAATHSIDDTATMQAFACGHFKNICNPCFINLVIAEKDMPDTFCPICRSALDLRSNILKNQITAEILKNFNRDMKLMQDNTGVSKEMILERWPRILEIGRHGVQCTNTKRKNLLMCAFHVLGNEHAVDVVTPVMEQYALHEQEFFNKAFQMDGAVIARTFSKVRLYEDCGKLITLQEAFRKAFNMLGGFRVELRLRKIFSLFHQASNVAFNPIAYPGLNLYRKEKLSLQGVKMDFTVEQAFQLIDIPYLNTNAIRDQLQAISDGHAIADSIVDDYIQEKYPDLVEFKNIGQFKCKDATIRYFALMELHPVFKSALHHSMLKKLHREAEDVVYKFDAFIASKYSHCQNALSECMDNVPGHAITLLTALKFSCNRRIPRDELNHWKRAINEQLVLHGCSSSPQQTSLRTAVSQNAASLSTQ